MSTRRAAKYKRNRDEQLGQHDGVYDEKFEVECILDRKLLGNRPVYKIKWVGYPLSECTWEPLAHLSQVMDLVDAYEEVRKLEAEIPEAPLDEFGHPIRSAVVMKETSAETSKVMGKLEVDTPVGILAGRLETGRVICKLEWARRLDGTLPLPSEVHSDEIKEEFPELLLDFYESQLKF